MCQWSRLPGFALRRRSWCARSSRLRGSGFHWRRWICTSFPPCSRLIAMRGTRCRWSCSLSSCWDCVPVMLLIAATGIAFGPCSDRCTRWRDVWRARRPDSRSAAGWAGSAWSNWAASASPASSRALKRNGTLAVFLVRKVPAPFTLVNIVVGASTVRLPRFHARHRPRHGRHRRRPRWVRISVDEGAARSVAGNVVAAALFVGVPLTLAWLINRALRRGGAAA